MTNQCRTCGSIIYDQNAKNLFKMENADILVNIELVSGTTLVNEPDLPNAICSSCLRNLTLAIIFRDRCVKTQEHFLQRRLWQNQDNDKLTNDEVNVEAHHGFDIENSFDDVDREVEDLLGFPESESEYNNNSMERAEDAYEDEELTEDAETLITTMQKEMQSFCEDYSDNQDEEPDNIVEVASLSRSPIARIVKKKSPGRPRKITVRKSKSNRKVVKNSSDPSGVNEATRKTYRTWKNLTEEEATERKREQRRRDCICEQCGRHFTDQSNFKLHMLRHTGVKNFACRECGKGFYTEHLMTLHERIVHKGEKPYACKYCGKTFHNSTTRLVHERIHTNARPYSCEYCEKAFSSASGRKRHELVHTGIRPFYCATCDQPFQRSTHLKAHFKSKLHITRAARQRHLPQLKET